MEVPQEVLTRLDWYQLISQLFPYLSFKGSANFLLSLKPSLNLERAKEQRAKTQALLALFRKGELPLLPSLPEIAPLIKKGQARGFFLPSELRVMALLLKEAKSLKVLQHTPFFRINQLGEELSPLLEHLMERINLETSEVKEQASYQLFLIRRKVRELSQLILDRLNTLQSHYHRLGYLTEDMYTLKKGRYVLPVKPEYKKKVKGILHEVSSTQATYFIEPISLINPTNQLEELKSREEAEIRKILRELSQEVFPYSHKILDLERSFLELDLAIAKVKLGQLYEGVLPEFNSQEALIFKRAIHPLLLLNKGAEGAPPVRNDLILEKGLLITGPNQGGKTVTLKTIGLLLLMAYDGFLLPAEEAKIPLFTKLFVDLGDEQNILLGESSFSSHLKNLKEILNQADGSSLVLLDEPGRNTNPEEGSLLAFAILEKLWEKKSTIAVTTHSHLLRDLIRQNLTDFTLASMEFDPITLKPLYKLRYGKFEVSHAFDLAKQIGLDEDLIARAISLSPHKEFYQWQNLLNQEREELKAKERALLKEREELNTLRQKLEEEKRALTIWLEEERKKLFFHWEKKFKEFFNRWQKEERGYKSALSDLANFLKEVKSTEPKQDLTFKVGEEVLVKALAKKGRILKLWKEEALVQVGAKKIKILLAELAKISWPEEAKSFPLKSSSLSYPREDLSEERINLLGLDVETALLEVERAMNDCFLKGKRRLLIVHGHGTGKLRRAIWDYLQGHPLVESFTPAPPESGGTGATVVLVAER